MFGVAAPVVLPDVVEDLRLRQHAAGVEHQVAQQLELGGGQVDGLPGADAPRGESSSSSRSAYRSTLRVVVETRPGAAQDRADPGDDLLQAERLGDVVVAADGQALDLVGGVVARGEEQHGDVLALLAQPAGDGEPVHVGEHHVEHHEVGLDLAGEAQRGAAVGGREHLEAGEPQGGREQLADVRLVVDDEQTCLRGCRQSSSLRPDPGSSLGECRSRLECDDAHA